MSLGKFLNKVYFCSLNSKDFQLEIQTETTVRAKMAKRIMKEKFKVDQPVQTIDQSVLTEACLARM